MQNRAKSFDILEMWCGYFASLTLKQNEVSGYSKNEVRKEGKRHFDVCMSSRCDFCFFNGEQLIICTLEMNRDKNKSEFGPKATSWKKHFDKKDCFFNELILIRVKLMTCLCCLVCLR